MQEGLNILLLILVNHKKLFIGNFEFQVISGRLESSGYTPPRTDYEYAGTKFMYLK